MDALDLLTDDALTALASALRSGRLLPPFTGVSVQRFSLPPQAALVAARLQQLHDEGMQPSHLALLAETIVRTRSRQPQESEVADLVWTGPEALGVTNRDTGVVVRDLFGSAEAEVLVAGFAVYQGRAVFKRLAERMAERPGLRVRLFLDVQRTRPANHVSTRDRANTNSPLTTRVSRLRFVALAALRQPGGRALALSS